MKFFSLSLSHVRYARVSQIRRFSIFTLVPKSLFSDMKNWFGHPLGAQFNVLFLQKLIWAPKVKRIIFWKLKTLQTKNFRRSILRTTKIFRLKVRKSSFVIKFSPAVKFVTKMNFILQRILRIICINFFFGIKNTCRRLCRN